MNKTPLDRIIEQNQKIAITETKNNAPKNPILSIIIPTYNHEGTIIQCLTSVLKQETSFSFEILLMEDDSDDGTRKICKQFAKNNPDKIRLFLNHRENNMRIWGQPTGMFNSLKAIQTARGKYMTVLEGDDYYSGLDKLEKQVSLLEQTNADCCQTLWHNLEGNIMVPQPNGIAPDSSYFYLKPNKYRYFHTSTRIINTNVVKEIIEHFGYHAIRDSAVQMILHSRYTVVVLCKHLSVYRKTGIGIYTSFSLRKRARQEFKLSQLLQKWLPEKTHSFTRRKWDWFAKAYLPTVAQGRPRMWLGSLFTRIEMFFARSR